jgi:hypothetical protein
VKTIAQEPELTGVKTDPGARSFASGAAWDQYCHLMVKKTLGGALPSPSQRGEWDHCYSVPPGSLRDPTSPRRGSDGEKGSKRRDFASALSANPSEQDADGRLLA